MSDASNNRIYRQSPAAYDGRGDDPPYMTVTDVDEAERNERERCAVIAETTEVLIDLRDWTGLTRKVLTALVAKGIADAIRNQ